MALDRVSRSVVVAVRGTWSLADFVTDIIAVPKPADWWLPPSLQQVCSYIAAGLYWLWEAGSYGVIGDGRCTATLELKIYPSLPLFATWTERQERSAAKLFHKDVLRVSVLVAFYISTSWPEGPNLPA